MSRNSGVWINRETNYLYNGDRAITDTFQMSDGTLVFHTYNVSKDGSEHSHQIMDEYGHHIYARAMGGDHPWIELDRPDYIYAARWLNTLTEDKIEKVLKVTNSETLRFIIQTIVGGTSIEKEDSCEKRFSM